MRLVRWIILTVFAFGAVGAAGAAELRIQNTLAVPLWQAYAARFLDESGRIIDNANGGISHTEGQGYGMLLALAADDRASFERIWSFTRTQLLLRSDGLAAWSWRPSEPHVPDINNASDGDLLLAYALAAAGRAWQVPRYIQAAVGIATALGSNAVIMHNGVPILLPAVQGFGKGDRDDAPVVNLSYWVFEALPLMQQLAPKTDWMGLQKSGLSLIGAARFGNARLPSDWISLSGKFPAPAAGFDPVFGYNAIRIPLYLIRAGISDPALLGPFADAWRNAERSGLPLINVATNQVTAMPTNPGYRMLPALIACVTAGTPLPPDLKMFTPMQYFPSTLFLLSISYISERHPECL